MAIIAMKCPECHGDIELDDTRDFGFCVYCGTKIMVERNNKLIIDNSENIEKWLRMAENALESGFSEEAYKYSIKVTDIDPENLRAWEIRLQSTDDPKEFKYCKIQILQLGGNTKIKYKNTKSSNHKIEFVFPDEFAKIDYNLLIDDHAEGFTHKKLKYETELKEGPHTIKVVFFSGGFLFPRGTTIEEELLLTKDCVVKTVKRDGNYTIIIEE